MLFVEIPVNDGEVQVRTVEIPDLHGVEEYKLLRLVEELRGLAIYGVTYVHGRITQVKSVI